MEKKRKPEHQGLGAVKIARPDLAGGQRNNIPLDSTIKKHGKRVHRFFGI